MKQRERRVTILQKLGGGANMLVETIYLFFIYILFFELVIATIVIIALFTTLVITIRKLDKKKNTSLLDR